MVTGILLGGGAAFMVVAFLVFLAVISRRKRTVPDTHAHGPDPAHPATPVVATPVATAPAAAAPADHGHGATATTHTESRKPRLVPIFIFAVVLGIVGLLLPTIAAPSFIPATTWRWIWSLPLLVIFAGAIAAVIYFIVLVLNAIEDHEKADPFGMALSGLMAVVLIGIVLSSWPQITASTWWNFGQASAASVCTGVPRSETLTTTPQTVRHPDCSFRWYVEAGCVDFLNTAGVAVLRNVCVGGGERTVTSLGILQARATTGTAQLRINWCRENGTTVEQC